MFFSPKVEIFSELFDFLELKLNEDLFLLILNLVFCMEIVEIFEFSFLNLVFRWILAPIILSACIKTNDFSAIRFLLGFSTNPVVNYDLI